MNLLWCKTNVERFGLNNVHQDFDIMRVVHTEMDDFRLQEQIKCIQRKRYKRAYIDDFKTICIYENLPISVYFRRNFLVS